MLPVPPVRLESDFQIYGNGNVRPHRVRFDPADPAFVSRGRDGLLTFRLLGPATTTEVTLAIRTDAVNGYAMDRIGSAGSVSVWEVVVDPPAAAFEFTLALLLEGGVPVYLAPTGIASAIERLDRFTLSVSNVPYHDVPEWARGAAMYQIFPERFASGDPSLDPPGVEPWAAKPSSRSFLGGDLIGIAENVEHLVELGVDVVYLNPIFTSPSNHRYDTVDYLSVDPSLGGAGALTELVEALHSRGMRVILDASFNHCHPRFFAFADLVSNGAESEYVDWFAIHEWPVRVRYRPHLLEPDTYWGVHLDRLQRESGVPVEAVDDDGPVIEPLYDAWYGVPLMPRVNLANPEARRYMLDVASYWVREFGVDGWRMDVVRYIDHDFWGDMRREVRAIKPDAYLLAEVMGDAKRWLAGAEFDGVMNYTFRELALDYFGTGTIGTTEFLEGLLEMTVMYSPAAGAVNQNLVGSHDTPRFLTLAGGDEQMLLLATLFQLTFPGIAGLYYGDELPMEGAGDPDNRRGMDWSATGGSHHRAVIELAQLRRAHPALQQGDWRLISQVGDAFAYTRTFGDDRMVVAINRGTSTVLLPPLGVVGALWATGDTAVSVDGVRIGPASAAIFDGRE